MDSWNFAEVDRITADLTALRLLGGGDSAEAYLAFDEHTWSPVVAKLLRPDRVTDESSLRGLRREVRALSTINHPVVVRGLRHELGGPRPHVVLEHIDGPRLSTLVRRYGPLQEAQYLPLAIDVAASLHYLRRIGFVHLDIKPSNVIMGAPARLIDLSAARTVEEAEALDHVVGTDAWMAPEQCDPGTSGAPGVASDVWGLGATLFLAVTGREPFPTGSPDGRTAAERHPQVEVGPGALPDSTPHEVVKVVLAALERDPANRPAPHEVADTLEPVLANLPRGHLAGFKIRR